MTVVLSPVQPWRVEAKRNEKGAWCVLVNGRLVSDHADHVGARIAAQQLVKAGPP